MSRIGMLDRYHDKPDPNSCTKKSPGYGHPIYPLTGSKSLKEELGGWNIGGQRVVAGYDTRRKAQSAQGIATFSAAAAPSFGELWASSLQKNLVFQTAVVGSQKTIQASRGAGAWVSFALQSDGSYSPDPDVLDRLVVIAGGWRYIDAAARAQETYDSTGKLLGVSYASGSVLTYTYSIASTPANVAPAVGLLIAVQDQLGRSAQFTYEQPSGVSTPRIKQIIDASGQAVTVLYDGSNNLSQLTWPDGKSRQYLYERSDIPWALTGVIDENASRLATYGYDAQGRANETQWAGGADRYSVSYSIAPGWNIVQTFDSTGNTGWRDHYWQVPEGTTITKPNGSTSNLSAALVQGMPSLTSLNQPAGSGCAASTSSMSYDANGNVEVEDDFNGNRVCRSHDLSRNLESVRVQGLPTTQTCGAVTAANATLPTGSRKVSTQWHPDWRLATKTAEHGRITTSVYNGQPDPFNANATASCAPGTALLPDGKPIVVLCKTVEQATTDSDGSLGFGAALQAGVAVREQKWTYNQYGQVLTHDGPRTDVSDLTSYTYHAATTADVMLGDLATMTNAAGKVTSYSKYNRHGQLLQSTDPNGVVTINTYDLRQRLKSSSVGGQTTSYDYDAAGQLTHMTRPDASWIGYEYDAAHRQTAVLDNKGNRIDYTLDNAGNKTGQAVKDPGGALRRTMARSIDALGRVQQTTGRE
jgi:YD repeat-containing protein